MSNLLRFPSILFILNSLDLFAANMASSELDQFRALVDKSELIERDAPGYAESAAPWSPLADQRPPLVVQPTSLDSMSKVVKFLYDSKLDFVVRNTGTGCVSARDVILSTHGFKDFDFDQSNEILTLGSGYDWGTVDRKMEKLAPNWQVLSARCTWVGVTGAALTGGLSWLSHEFGELSSPPPKKLYSQVVDLCIL